MRVRADACVRARCLKEGLLLLRALLLLLLLLLMLLWLQ